MRASGGGTGSGVGEGVSRGRGENAAWGGGDRGGMGDVGSGDAAIDDAGDEARVLGGVPPKKRGGLNQMGRHCTSLKFARVTGVGRTRYMSAGMLLANTSSSRKFWILARTAEAFNLLMMPSRRC